MNDKKIASELLRVAKEVTAKPSEVTAAKDAVPMSEWPPAVIDVIRSMGIGINDVKEVREPLRTGQFIIELKRAAVVTGGGLRKGLAGGLDGLLIESGTILVKV